ncbi:uncharacterized protein LOC102503516 [Camelus ferus]|uniref:Uncharacterized protein LOC102503516 n=1 Tax=Camelus ferus TaxID=419612 RepID=A0A8B8SYR8_CAMFR|nr:uncharacterized protein LOC102503516 [Camelus ferus]
MVMTLENQEYEFNLRSVSPWEDFERSGSGRFRPPRDSNLPRRKGRGAAGAWSPSDPELGWLARELGGRVAYWAAEAWRRDSKRKPPFGSRKLPEGEEGLSDPRSLPGKAGAFCKRRSRGKEKLKFERLEWVLHDSWRQLRDRVCLRRLLVKPRGLEVLDKHSLAFVVCIQRINGLLVSTLWLTPFRAMPEKGREEMWLLAKEAQRHKSQIHRQPSLIEDQMEALNKVHSAMQVGAQRGEQLFLTGGLKYFVLELGLEKKGKI